MLSVIRSLALAAAFFAVPALVLVRAVPAHAAPDEVLRPGERVRVVLAEGDSRSVAIGGLEGGRWTISVVPTGKSKAAPTFSLVDPGGEIVDLGKALRNVGRGKGVKSFPMSKSGVWRLTFGTPAGKPGEVEISVTAKLPKTPRIAGTTSGDPATGAIPFQAMPSSVCDASVKLAAKPALPVTLTIIGPDDADVASAAGTANSAALDDVTLERTGSHTLAVAGGPAKFTGALRVKAAKPRRDLTFAAVEALPEFRSISPLTTTNDVTRTFQLGGFGFSGANTLVLKLNGATKRTGVVVPQPDGSAKATMSLDDLGAGSYTASVSLPGGRSVTITDRIDVSNLAPIIVSAVPPEAPNHTVFDVYLVGQGFDPASTLDCRRASDGATIAVSQSVRADPRTWRARFTPQLYKTGVYDLRVVEGGVPGAALAGGIDVLGKKGPEISLRTGGTSLYVFDTAVDDALGRIGIAYIENSNATFHLVDAATGQLLSSYAPSRPANSQHHSPRIAFHPVEKTWALNWTLQPSSGPAQAWHGTAARSSFSNPAGAGAAWSIASPHDNTEAVPDVVNGGWRFVWSQFVAGTGPGYIRSAPVSSSGVVDTARTITVASHPDGWVAYPDAVARSDGDIVVAFLALDAFGDLSVFRSVIAPNGTIRVASGTGASGSAWQTIYAPLIALNPLDDSAVVGFTYREAGILKPAFFRLDPETHAGGPVGALVSDGIAPVGYVDNVAWSAERAEFVASLTTVDYRTTIRRVNADGSIRPAYTLEQYEGIFGLFCSVAGELHHLRSTDGTDDGYYDSSLNRHVIRLFRLR